MYYHGSSVEVQERMTVITNITNPELIDVDFKWFKPKKYIGTWQVLPPTVLNTWAEGTYGYLNGEVQEIIFRSRYTIVANPDTPKGIGDQFEISSCNFFLEPGAFIIPPNVVPTPGYKAIDLFPQFGGTNTYRPAPLANTEYNQFIGGIGLYLNPGVEGIALNYDITIINDIYTDYDQYISPTCFLLPATCEQQFEAFMTDNAQFYLNQSICEANNPPCQQFTWVCPSNPLVSFPYWEGTLM
jgi:hypothetical protein